MLGMKVTAVVNPPQEIVVMTMTVASKELLLCKRPVNFSCSSCVDSLLNEGLIVCRRKSDVDFSRISVREVWIRASQHLIRRTFMLGTKETRYDSGSHKLRSQRGRRKRRLS
jgi:hypothetical protein